MSIEIYNRALSAAEIRAIFKASDMGKCETTPELTSSDSQATPTLLSEQFATTELGSNWSIVKGVGLLGVEENILSLSGGEHKRLNTQQKFSATPAGVSTKARIRLGGDYQKFGFGVNAEHGSPRVGLYFDTFSRSDGSGGHENAIHLLILDASAGLTSPVSVLDEEVAVTWNEFHEFEIIWTISTVSFYIDDELKAAVPYTFHGTLPVGVWNDRSQLMQVDWVEVVEMR